MTFIDDLRAADAARVARDTQERVEHDIEVIKKECMRFVNRKVGDNRACLVHSLDVCMCVELEDWLEYEQIKCTRLDNDEGMWWKFSW